MKGMQQAGLVQGPVLNCPDGASKTRMGNQEHPGKSCAHIQSAERWKERPCTALCSRLFPSPGLLLLPSGEDRALLGGFLRSGCFQKHLLGLAHREARSTARHIPRSCVCKDTVSAHHPDLWDVCLEEDECRGDCTDGHSVGTHRHGTKLWPRLNSLCSGCRHSSIFRL